MSDIATCAIGDVHGQADRLEALHEKIFSDIAGHGVHSRIIHLGDLIDRGPRSRDCITLAMKIEEADDAIDGVTLLGNHEQMMLSAVLSPDRADYDFWMRNGGRATLESYIAANGSFEDWALAIDRIYLEWLGGRPTIFRSGSDVFVHAGIDPETFPLDDPAAHLWTRRLDFFDDATWPERPVLAGLRVVHGHTPTQNFQPQVTGRRINIDTGGVFGGPLTAVVLAGDEPPRFLTT
jgi:serine/threonine protein phosphatase 1